MKTRLSRACLLLSALIGLLAGCMDDENDDNRKRTGKGSFPEVSQILITDTVMDKTGGGMVYITETYSFADNRLTTHHTLQEYAHDQQLECSYGFAYSGNEVTLTDESDNEAVYRLGANGFAETCTYRTSSVTREYSFTYTDDYLTRIEEKINGEVSASADLEYTSGNLQSIVQTLNNQSYKILCRTGELENTYQLPFIRLADVYPLSFHTDALYARLLGKQSAHMVIRTEPEGDDVQEWTEYRYTTDAKNVPVAVTISTTSTGIIIDIFGNSSAVTETDSWRRGYRVE